MNRFGLVRRDFFDDFDKSLNDFFTPQLKRLEPVQMVEKEKFFQINVDLPGVKREDVDIEVNEDILTVHAERKNEFDTEGVYEKSYREFKRSFRIPKNVSQDGLEASLEDGVLRLTLPKASISASPRKIEIGVPNHNQTVDKAS